MVEIINKFEKVCTTRMIMENGDERKNSYFYSISRF